MRNSHWSVGPTNKKKPNHKHLTPLPQMIKYYGFTWKKTVRASH